MGKHRGFADAVKEKRKILGWSQRQLAAKSFCSIDTIRAIEQGKSNYHPSIEMVKNIANCLGIDENAYDHSPVQGRTKTSRTNIREKKNILPSRKYLRYLKYLYLLAVAVIITLLVTHIILSIKSANGLITLFRNNPSEEYVSVFASGREILDGGIVHVGEIVTVKFRIQNSDTHRIRILCLVISARGPGVHKADHNGWEAPPVSFPCLYYPALEPGNILFYEGSQVFIQPGDYFVEPTFQDIVGRWGGIQPFTRIYINVVR